ncbi:hypothetical protein MMIN_04930 [Mycolicibacter minnesotensis]|nr:hypothetical protein MMIN_04930 [Mycolicibacter minnesotensis]
MRGFASSTGTSGAADAGVTTGAAKALERAARAACSTVAAGATGLPSLPTADASGPSRAITASTTVAAVTDRTGVAACSTIASDRAGNGGVVTSPTVATVAASNVVPGKGDTGTAGAGHEDVVTSLSRRASGAAGRSASPLDACVTAASTGATVNMGGITGTAVTTITREPGVAAVAAVTGGRRQPGCTDQAARPADSGFAADATDTTVAAVTGISTDAAGYRRVLAIATLTTGTSGAAVTADATVAARTHQPGTATTGSTGTTDTARCSVAAIDTRAPGLTGDT